MLNPLQCHPGNPATVSMFQPSWTKPICTCLNCREWFPPFYTTSPTQHHFWVTQGHARVILLTVIVTLSLLNKFRVRLSVSMITCRPVCYWKTAPFFQPFGKLFSELLFSRAVAEADELPWPQTSPCINCGENVLKIKALSGNLVNDAINFFSPENAICHSFMSFVNNHTQTLPRMEKDWNTDRLRQSHRSVFHLWKIACHTSATTEVLLFLTQLLQ